MVGPLAVLHSTQLELAKQFVRINFVKLGRTPQYSRTLQYFVYLLVNGRKAATRLVKTKNIANATKIDRCNEILNSSRPNEGDTHTKYSMTSQVFHVF